MQYTHEHEEIQRTLKRFIDAEINPHVDEWEAAEEFPAHQVFKRLGELGLLGLTKPEKYGGMSLDYSYSVAMAETLGHVACGGVPMAIGVQTDMCTPALARFGSEAERAGMIKHGSKQIQALSNAAVPQITIHCGASFGAGNYGMCGRGFGPRFVFAWPTAKTAVMGAEQAAGTMEIVMREGAARKGEPVEEAKLAALKDKIVATFERQADAFYTSGLLLDDGIIDPRDTRRVVALALAVCDEAARRTLHPMQFGVARP